MPHAGLSLRHTHTRTLTEAELLTTVSGLSLSFFILQPSPPSLPSPLCPLLSFSLSGLLTMHPASHINVPTWLFYHMSRCAMSDSPANAHIHATTRTVWWTNQQWRQREGSDLSLWLCPDDCHPCSGSSAEICVSLPWLSDASVILLNRGCDCAGEAKTNATGG